MDPAALRAYGAAVQALSQTGAAAPGDPAPAPPGFGEMIAGAVETAQARLSQAEGAATDMALGRGDLIDVVTAVSAAEVTLGTVVAVRDEVIRAYQEILRMPI